MSTPVNPVDPWYAHSFNGYTGEPDNRFVCVCGRHFATLRACRAHVTKARRVMRDQSKGGGS